MRNTDTRPVANGEWSLTVAEYDSYNPRGNGKYKLFAI